MIGSLAGSLAAPLGLFNARQATQVRPHRVLCGSQNALKLKAGDILIFGKTKEGELLLGGRARTASDKDRKAPPRTRKSTETGDKPAVKSEPGLHAPG